MTTDSRVLGLDLSITATGWALPDSSGVWRQASAVGDGRLMVIRQGITELYSLGGPFDLAVLEDLPTHAHGAGITGMVHGAVRTLLQHLGVPYALVSPATLKKYATGRGNCGKPDMRMELYKRLGADLPDDNQVDAWWLMHAGLQHHGIPILDLPAAHRAALDKVRWPDTGGGLPLSMRNARAC